MSYFTDHYKKLQFPIAENGQVGFRPAQVAAAQAVASHFFGSNTPAIVTMPTGAGKTTVLMACTFLLKAKRVLVITPSRLVREQIAENFKVLADLKKIEAIPLDLATPKVFATQKTTNTAQQWEDLRKFDVVIATVPSLSGGEKDRIEPPRDLFDVVLVDEAHHSPASTWARLLALFSEAKQVLFTATPFRRDEKEIKGRFVFSYDLRQACKDRVFGDIIFEPVRANESLDIDTTIAQATEKRFAGDRDKGLKHLVMVRVDSIARGKALAKIYEEKTSLKLAFVTGADSLKKVSSVISKLKSGELEGIICVNMFGEGFNLPALKIAAIHSPHKSLAVTLQFIGRFARTNQADIGSATFLAEPMDSNAEISELYEKGAVWREIIQNLSEARVESEINRRNVLDSFVIDAIPDMSDFSIYTVRPYFHVKIFKANAPVSFAIDLDFPVKHQIIFKGISETNASVLYITRQTIRSSWSTDERFTNVSFDMFLFYYNPNPGLLFICSSRRDDVLYNRLAAQLLDSRPRILPHSVISRALNGLEAAAFFSVGMRKRHTFGRIESYRTSSGTSADRAIHEADSKNFGRGHCFGTAMEDGKPITIGVSASSKVWSNTYDQIPELLVWCDRIAEKLASGISSPTGSRLDLLSVGEELRELPDNVIAVNWPARAYRDQPFIFYNDKNGEFVENQLLDFDLSIVRSEVGQVTFAVSKGKIEWQGIFEMSDDELITPASSEEPDLTVNVGNEDVPIVEYLNSFLPVFYCADLSSIDGINHHLLDRNLDPFGTESFEVIDWKTAQVLITKEVWDGSLPKSIFDWVSEHLLASSADVVFCDHGSGEVADFVAIETTSFGPVVRMYHCKGSGGHSAGNRVSDLYEACGQAVKSTIWLHADDLLDRLKHRQSLPSIKGYVKGDESKAAEILGLQAKQQIQFEIFIVQPGVKKDGREAAISEILAATKHYLVAMSGVQFFGLLSS